MISLKAIIYNLVLFFCFNSFIAQNNPLNLTLATPLTLSADETKRAQTSIKLQPNFKYGAGVSGNSLTLQISKYPGYVASGYANPPSSCGLSLNSTNPFVGETSGDFAVTAQGQANYNIPIFVSPGTAGMQPNIGLSYVSGTGSGIAGEGFNISGLSAITRTNKNPYFDGKYEGINLDFTDVFALNGSRLITVSGNTGYAGSTYSSELENYSLITAMSNQGNGPEHFVVKEKNGMTIKFGESIDSKLVGVNGDNTILAWLVSSITDEFGNYMLFHYKNLSGEVVIDYIAYTGNVAANLAPYCKVSFEYIQKTEVNKYYVAGTEFNNTQLLKTITCSNTIGNTDYLVKKYSLQYIFEQRTLLQSITEANADGTELRPTEFCWENPANNSTYANMQSAIYPVNSSLYSQIKKIVPADLNGDGLSDIVSIRSNDIDYLKNDYLNFIGSGGSTLPFSTAWTSALTFGSNSIEVATVLDDNFDNKQDVYFIQSNGSSKQYTIRKVTETGITTFATKSTTNTFLSGQIPSKFFFDKNDYTGDGIKETIIIDPEKISVTGGSGNFIFTFGNALTIAKPFDFNGDGVLDFITIKNNTTSLDIAILKLTNSGFTTIYNKTISFAGNVSSSLLRQIGFGDFNGDRKTDLLYMNFNKSKLFIEYSDGKALLAPQEVSSFTPLTSPNNYNISCPDFNGDGYSDIIMTDNNTSPLVTNYQTYFSVGNNLIKGLTTSGYYNYNTIEVLKIYEIGKDVYKFVNENVTYSTGYQFQADFNGDGKIDVLSLDPASPNIIISGAIDNENRNIVSINTGLKKQIDVLYANTSTKINRPKEEIYADASGSYSGDLVSMNPNMFVVDEVHVGNSNTQFQNRSQYIYAGAIFHTKGKGFLGFESSASFDEHTMVGSKSLVEINTTNFLPQSSEQSNATFTSIFFGGKTIYNLNNLISKTKNIFQSISLGNKRYFFATSSSNTVNYLSANGSSSLYFYDQSQQGNLSSSVISYGWPGQVPIKVENNSYTYIQKNGRWRLNTKTYTNSQFGEPSYSRAIEYNYDNQGHLTSIINDPSFGVQSLQTSFTNFNVFGMPTKLTVSGDFTARVSETKYDGKGRFVIQSKNPLLQTEDFAYEPLYGSVIQKTDIRGLTSKFKYDGIGRLISTELPNNTINSVQYEYDNDGGYPNPTIYKKVVQNEGESEANTFYDSFGRVMKDLTQDALGNTLVSTNTYDGYGVLQYSTEPHFVSQQTYLATKYTQEATFFRPKKVEIVKYTIPSGGSIGVYTPTGLYTDYRYSNKILPNGTFVRAFIETKDNTGKLLRKEFNAAGQNDVVSNGQPSSVIIGSSEITQTASYHFNSTGQPKDVILTNTQDLTSTITHNFTYNQLAQQTQLNDPSAGIINYTYNSLGELLHQDDANGSWDYTYNNLGNIETKTGSQSGVTSYQYINSSSGLNLIEKITGPNVITEYSYDNLSRNTQIKETIGSKTFISEMTYDKYNHTTSYKYPSGFTTKHDYNTNGYLTTIKDAANNLIWQLDDINSAGQLTKYTYGNGIQTTVTNNDLHQLDLIDHDGIHVQDYNFNTLTSNLISRDFFNNDPLHSSHNFEKFVYDGLDRLNQSEQQDPDNFYAPIYTNNTSFDVLGNMTHKDDAAIGDFDYTNPNKPFNITQINNPTANIPTVPLNISYNDIQKVQQIKETSTLKEMNFVYGNDNERIKVDYLVNGANQYTRYYQANYETEETISGAKKEWNYIFAPNGLAAIYYKTSTTSGQLLYVLSDHLGSPAFLTDAGQTIVEKYSFDAWGRRRNPDNWSYVGLNPPQFLNRGFTFHEHIDEFNLINMNGRVYDPVLGRFIQPDNFIQDPDNIQNFNRYAYCYNNPLSYTDPSGNFTGLALFLGETAFLGTSYLFEGGHSNPYKDAWKETSYMFDETRNMLSFTSSYGSGNYTAGIDPFAMGGYIGMQAQNGNFDYSVTMGYGLNGPFAFGSVGYTNDNDTRFSVGGGLFSNGYAYGGSISQEGYGIEYYQTVYGKSGNNPTGVSNHQKVGGVRLFTPNGSFRLENDFLSQSGDRWRTNAWELQVGKFSIGSSIYTNDPESMSGTRQAKTDFDGTDMRGNVNKHGNGAWINGLVYDSPIWVGFNYGQGVSRLGYSHPRFQDTQQNAIHLYFPPGHQNFYNKYTPNSYGFYGYNSYNNPYSLWGK